MEENIVWNQALTRNKELTGDKIVTIDNKIMNINKYLEFRLYLLAVTPMQKVVAFIFGDVAKKRHGSAGVIYSSEIRKTWNI